MNLGESYKEDPLGKEERARSNFVRDLVQRPKEPGCLLATQLPPPPRLIVQFWDDLSRLPPDVKECMESWNSLEKLGFKLQVFDNNSARHFIQTHLGSRFAEAFDKCYHPSMKSDYFRYSYIYVMGGFYIDADDVFHGTAIEHLFKDGRLKLQPFCYDIETSQMVPPSAFLNQGADRSGWIFYFNTTPLIAAPKHPIVKQALFNATVSLEKAQDASLPEVQATTGPGNLTRSLFEILSNESCPSEWFVVAHDWEITSTSKWPLSYRCDQRNWRLSNQQAYQPSVISKQL